MASALPVQAMAGPCQLQTAGARSSAAGLASVTCRTRFTGGATSQYTRAQAMSILWIYADFAGAGSNSLPWLSVSLTSMLDTRGPLQAAVLSLVIRVG